MENDLEYRMYGLVPYNLSPIQQGIQFGHGVVEYMLNFPVDLETYRDTKKWAEQDKTFIILNGGTTNNNLLTTPIMKEKECSILYKGSLNNHLAELKYNNIKVASFCEPDLGSQLTAIVFLADERVWNIEKYPEFFGTNGLIRNIKHQPGYNQWVDSIGGEKNAWLREFLKQFRLA